MKCRDIFVFPKSPCSPLPRRSGVTLHPGTAGLRALQRGVPAPGGLQAHHAAEQTGPALRLGLLPVLGRGSAAGLELVRPRGSADLLLPGLGGAVLEQLQLPHPVHAAVLHRAGDLHHLLLHQSARLHEKGIGPPWLLEHTHARTHMHTHAHALATAASTRIALPARGRPVAHRVERVTIKA